MTCDRKSNPVEKRLQCQLMKLRNSVGRVEKCRHTDRSLFLLNRPGARFENRSAMNFLIDCVEERNAMPLFLPKKEQILYAAMRRE